MTMQILRARRLLPQIHPAADAAARRVIAGSLVDVVIDNSRRKILAALSRGGTAV